MLISGVRHHQRRIGDDVAPGTLAITGPGVCPLCLSLLSAPFVFNHPTVRNLFPAQGDNFLRYGSARVLHQTRSRNAQLVDSMLIYSSHLFSGDDKQGSSLPGE
jgi:hypothetical protein